MKIYIYGKLNCPMCEKAKQLCEKHGLDYDYYNAGVDFTVEELIVKVGKPVRSVPQIFVGQEGFFEYIGTYKNFEAWVANDFGNGYPESEAGE